MDFKAIYEEAVFQPVYESAMREREKSLREDNSSYVKVDPLVGLQPVKKVVVMDPTDDRTQYIYPDGTNVEDYYAP
jgi:hypothetical protein